MFNRSFLIIVIGFVSLFLLACEKPGGDQKSNEADVAPAKIPQQRAPTAEISSSELAISSAREEMNYCESNKTDLISSMKKNYIDGNYEAILATSRKCSYWLGEDADFTKLSMHATAKQEELNLVDIPKENFEDRLTAIELIVKSNPALKKKYAGELVSLRKIKERKLEEDQKIADNHNSKWRVSYDISPIDDSRGVTLTLNAETNINGWLTDDVNPSIVIRCKEGKTDAYIYTGMQANVEYNALGANVIMRIDKKPAYKLVASKSTDGEALFLPDAIQQIKKLLLGRELFFQFTPFNSAPQSTKFLIAGLSESITPVRQTCKW